MTGKLLKIYLSDMTNVVISKSVKRSQDQEVWQPLVYLLCFVNRP